MNPNMAAFKMCAFGFKAQWMTRNSLLPGRVQESRWLCLFCFLLLGALVPGCATKKDLKVVEQHVQERINSARAEFVQQHQSHGERIDHLDNEFLQLQKGFQDFQEEQHSTLVRVQEGMDASIGQLQAKVAELTKVRQELQEVRTDVALLKPLAMALDAIQERLDATTAVIKSLEKEAQEHRSLIVGIEGNVHELTELQTGISSETKQLKTVVGDLSQGVVEGLRIEIETAQNRIQKLQTMLDQISSSGAAEADPQRSGSESPG